MDVVAMYLDKAKAEFADLQAAGVVMSGNAFSQVLLVKGEPETDGTALLSGKDGEALHSALGALGYEPQDWAALATLSAAGEDLAPDTVRLAITTLDPATVIALDEGAAAALREAYADELIDMDDLNQATLQPGYVVPVLGMRVMALGGFGASLDDVHAKQQMWAYLKQLAPLGEPY